MRAEAQVWKDGLLESNDRKAEDENLENEISHESEQKLVAVVIPQRHRKRKVLRVSTLDPGSTEWVMSRQLSSDVSVGTKSGRFSCNLLLDRNLNFDNA